MHIGGSEYSADVPITFDTDHYVLSNNSWNAFAGIQLPLIAPVDNYVFQADVKVNTTRGGLGLLEDFEKGLGLVQPDSTTATHDLLYNPEHNMGWAEDQSSVPEYHVGEYHTHKITKQGNTVKYEILYEDVVIFSHTMYGIADNTATNAIPSLCANAWDGDYANIWFKNIKVQHIIYEDTVGGGNLAQYDITTNNTNNFIFDEDMQAYAFTVTSGDAGTVTLDTIQFSNNVQIQADMMINRVNSNAQPRIGLLNGTKGIYAILQGYSGGSHLYIAEVTGVKRVSEHSIAGTEATYSSNEWYHFDFTINGNQATLKVYNEDKTFFKTINGTFSDDILSKNGNILALQMGFSNGDIGYFKDIKVREL